MRFLYTTVLPFLLSALTPLLAQDTLSFGGVYDLPGAEVRSTYTPVSPLAQRFTIEEVYRLPGTFYDPARLVALLPGVVQTNDQANPLSVRGNTPNANLWRLNGLAIVNPNHTANAGTFYDFPTLSGGGVNAISAQMLGNSGFLAGGLPVEYGFATGGTFDLRLRPGSKTRRKYQAQAGFIGFDLMAEGPIGNSGKTSYLVNGRYSFTGLLADMGVDFGGEEIRFADVNAHLHHEWDGGELSAFAILGQSSNVFRGPDSTEQVITEQKELFDIDFESDLSIIGVSLSHAVQRFTFKLGGATSSVSSERTQVFSRQETAVSRFVLRTEPLVNANLKVEYSLTGNSSVSAGVEYLNQKVRSRSQIPGSNTSARGSAFFIGYSTQKGLASLSGGVRAVKYDDRYLDALRFEPRVAIKYGNISFLFEGNSRLPITPIYLNGFRNPLNAPINWQTTVGYQKRIRGVNTATRLFYQSTPAENAIRRDFAFISANNFLELDTDYNFTTTTATRRYGLELEAAGGKRAEGWYYRGSVTLLRAETRQPNGNWFQDRYSADFIGKLTLGREWPGRDKKERDRVYGLNLALITHGGERYGEVVQGESRYFSTPDVTNGFLNSTGTYFRPDLRLYKTKTRPKTTTTLALDVQNVANVQNTANVYYDAFLERPNERFQLGLIPVLSYRVVWR